MERLVQALVVEPEGNNILLVFHKQGEFEGLYTGLIGYTEQNERPELAMNRIAYELCRITLDNIELRAKFLMQVDQLGDAEELEYFCNRYSGHVMETETVRPQWFPITGIPYQQMPPDDEIWYPAFLAGSRLEGKFLFNKEMSVITAHDMNTVEDLSALY